MNQSVINEYLSPVSNVLDFLFLLRHCWASISLLLFGTVPLKLMTVNSQLENNLVLPSELQHIRMTNYLLLSFLIWTTMHHFSFEVHPYPTSYKKKCITILCTLRKCLSRFKRIQNMCLHLFMIMCRHRLTLIIRTHMKSGRKKEHWQILVIIPYPLICHSIHYCYFLLLFFSSFPIFHFVYACVFVIMAAHPHESLDSVLIHKR